MATRKKTGSRCRTIGGVVYDLTATDRKPPCARRQPVSPRKSTPPPGAPAPKPKPGDNELLTVEHSPAGSSYDLIQSTKDGTGGVARVLETYPTREEAKVAREVFRQTRTVRSPSNKPSAPIRRAPVRVNDLRVVERQEREREHSKREAFERSAAPKSALASAGRLPKRAKPAEPALKSTERSVLDAVRKRNGAGLLYHADAFKPSIHAMLQDLARRGFVMAFAPGKYYLPEFASELPRLSRNREAAPKPPTVDGPPAVRLGGYEKRRLKKMALPPSIDPSAAKVGERVSVFSYGSGEPNHAILKSLPGEPLMYGVSVEPAVLFVSGEHEGMNRSISWDRMFAGWLDPNVNWEPWRR